jgi:hypothetical protein
MCGSLFAAAGVAWGAQREGRAPWIALAGAGPGLALAAISTGFSIAAMAVGIGGFTLAVPVLILTGVALVTGLPAPLFAFVGAAFADAAWPSFKTNVARARRAVGLTDDDDGDHDDATMAY